MKVAGKWLAFVPVGILWLALAACGSPGSKGSPPPPTLNQWGWMTGSDMTNQAGTYGTQGVTRPGNTPGARVWPGA